MININNSQIKSIGIVSYIEKGLCRARKNLQNSEFSEGRLFDKIEWGMPLNTKNRLT